MSEDRYDTLMGNMANLNTKIEDFIKVTKMYYVKIQNDVDELKEDVKVVKKETGLINSRVNKLEDKHSTCPVNDISRDLADYKKDMKAIYLIATNWKMIATIVISTGFVMQAVGWFNKLIEHLVTKYLI